MANVLQSIAVVCLFLLVSWGILTGTIKLAKFLGEHGPHGRASRHGKDGVKIL